MSPSPPSPTTIPITTTTAATTTQQKQPEHSTKSSELRGYCLMLLAAVAYTVNNTLVRLVQSKYNVQPSAAIFIRSLIQTAFSTISLSTLSPSPQTRPYSLPSTSRILLLFRGALGAVALTLLYVAFQLMPVADAVAIFFTTPIFTLLFSFIFLSEPITATDIISALLSILGVTLITRSSNSKSILQTNHTLGAAAALSSAALTAIAYTIVRKLKDSVHFMASVLSMGACAFLLSIILGGMSNIMSIHDNEIMIILVTASLAGFVAQACMNRGLQLCRAGPGTLVRNVEVPLAYGVGIFALGERPVPIRVFGAFLVVGAAFLIGARKLMEQRLIVTLSAEVKVTERERERREELE